MDALWTKNKNANKSKLWCEVEHQKKKKNHDKKSLEQKRKRRGNAIVTEVSLLKKKISGIAGGIWEKRNRSDILLKKFIEPDNNKKRLS